jgi:hypothetical protein
MRTTIAAVDDSPALHAVACAAATIAARIGTRVVGIHVLEEGSPDADVLRSRCGFDVEVEAGTPVERLRAAIDAADVELAVVGSRDTEDPRAPVGHVALALAESITKPMLVVPPTAITDRWKVDRALLPLDGDPHTSEQVRDLVERLVRSGVEVVATHVFDAAHVPRWGDDFGHELEAFRHEFLTRHSPASTGLIVSHGAIWDAVVACAGRVEADLVVLAWSQRLAPGRAAVVRAALTNPALPVLLLPDAAEPADDTVRDGTAPTGSSSTPGEG